MDKRKNFFTVVLICSFIFSINSYAINWRHNINSAVEEAKKSNKYIMIDFTASWCGWCKKLDTDTYANSGVARLLETNFVCVKVNGDENPDIVRKYGVRGYPTIAFLNSSGSVINQISGYRPPKDFLVELNKIISKKPKGSEPGKSFIDEIKERMKPVQKAIKKATAGKYVLSGIQFNTKEPSAIINDKLVKTGDKVEDAVLTKINPDSVELQTPEKKVKLTI